MTRQPASTWDPSVGHVTRAYDDWALSEKELRAFLRLSMEFAEEGYDARWKKIQAMPGDEWSDAMDLMDREVDGLIPHQFEWFVANFCIRDGLTLYEAYLEKSLEELAGFQIGRLPVADRSPFMRDFRTFFSRTFGVDACPPGVQEVIDLRDLLTHRRGELRAEHHRARYDTKEFGFPDLTVPLKRSSAGTSLDALSSAVATVDAAMFRYSWGAAVLTAEHKIALQLLLDNNARRRG